MVTIAMMIDVRDNQRAQFADLLTKFHVRDMREVDNVSSTALGTTTKGRPRRRVRMHNGKPMKDNILDGIKRLAATGIQPFGVAEVMKEVNMPWHAASYQNAMRDLEKERILEPAGPQRWIFKRASLG
jgi:hypothetical protein